MKNLVFRSCLMAMLCWQLTAAERSANGYFYDKPEGIAFEETPGSVQLLAAPQHHQQAPVSVAMSLQQLQPPPLSYAGGSNLEIVPATLVYEHTKTYDTGLQQPPQVLQDSVVNFIQPQLNYRENLQPVAFTIKEANGVAQPCGVQPIVAQVNPALVNLSGGGPLTRVITTCGPDNNCNSITVQSDLKRHLGAVQSQQFNSGSLQRSFEVPEARSAASVDSSVLLVRPQSRRLVEYTEIESNDPYN